MDFQQLANEYFASAEACQKAVERYERLRSERKQEDKYLNAKISQFKRLYAEVKQRAEDMQARADKFKDT